MSGWGDCPLCGGEQGAHRTYCEGYDPPPPLTEVEILKRQVAALQEANDRLTERLNPRFGQ